MLIYWESLPVNMTTTIKCDYCDEEPIRAYFSTRRWMFACANITHVIESFRPIYEGYQTKLVIL